jgi:hypothetical protein
MSRENTAGEALRRAKWKEGFDQKIAKTVDTLIYQTTKHLGLVQKRVLNRKTYREEIIAEALLIVARELYGKKVTVKFARKELTNRKSKTLRFVVSCERGDSPLEVFPVTLSR